jgi:hypothetical protein
MWLLVYKRYAVATSVPLTTRGLLRNYTTNLFRGFSTLPAHVPNRFKLALLVPRAGGQVGWQDSDSTCQPVKPLICTRTEFIPRIHTHRK